MICELKYQINVSLTENTTSYAINKGFWEEEIIIGDRRDGERSWKKSDSVTTFLAAEAIFSKLDRATKN